MRMNGITANSLRILDARLDTKRNQAVPSGAGIPAEQPNFNEVLQVQFSKHASSRLNARNINLTGEQMARVEDGIVKANEKGIRDSLVLVDDVALVINVKSRTVITAMNQQNDNVFSNIDGAVIV